MPDQSGWDTEPEQTGILASMSVWAQAMAEVVEKGPKMAVMESSSATLLARETVSLGSDLSSFHSTTTCLPPMPPSALT